MGGTASNTAALDYQGLVTSDIGACVSQMGCQPILFVGSGLSKRYFGGPSWDELLATLAKECPLIDKEYAYYKQTLKHPTAIGEEFAKLYQQWAWGLGRDQFPSDMFSENVPAQAYIKYAIARLLKSLTPPCIADIASSEMKEEIAALQNIRPHALITTNFDQFLEEVFPEYQPIIGQSIIHGTQVLFGEIFKIHGCVSDYQGIVFTEADYAEFTRKKKYLSAKLLTYFSEHPLLFVGYSASDPNIKAVLSDIDECLPRRGSLGAVVPNIYILEWRGEKPGSYAPAREKLIQTDEGRSIRIKCIESPDFGWVFAAFGGNQPLNAVSPKILRALLHRSYDLVRYDIPRRTVDADFEMLERAVNADGNSFAKLFGITTISKPTSNSADFPYTLSLLAEKVIGVENAYWGRGQPFLDRLIKEHGINIKKSDNRYHSATKTGKKSVVHKYSEDLLDLILKMKAGEEYKFQL
jgi:SIR2-like domain